MSEFVHPPYFTRTRMAVAVGVLLLTASGCDDEEISPPVRSESRTPPVAVSVLGQDAVDACMAVIATDADCDGVVDSLDQVASMNDYGDTDSDGVINALDRYPLKNDLVVDSDGDGLADAFDSFLGDNLADNDNDGLINGIDLAPDMPSGSDVTAQDANYGDQAVLNAIRSEAFQQVLDHNLYVLPLDNEFTLDDDGDGYANGFETEPNDGYITPENDPYNYSNDAWGEPDPYDNFDDE